MNRKCQLTDLIFAVAVFVCVCARAAKSRNGDLVDNIETSTKIVLPTSK